MSLSRVCTRGDWGMAGRDSNVGACAGGRRRTHRQGAGPAWASRGKVWEPRHRHVDSSRGSVTTDTLSTAPPPTDGRTDRLTEGACGHHTETQPRKHPSQK